VKFVGLKLLKVVLEFFFDLKQMAEGLMIILSPLVMNYVLEL
jgi:hypothetical protein